jgi:hypothetical protein
MTGAEFIARLGPMAKPRKTTDGWECCCPAHEDKRASLSVSQKGDRVLVHCHAGCTPEEICAAVEIRLADLFAGKPPRNEKPGKQIVAMYDYRNANGEVAYQVVRFDPKDFRQRKPDANAKDGWMWNIKGVEKILFRLPEITREIQQGLPVFLCEGEKDVLAMRKHGFAATCNPGGAGKWQDSFSETLRGADVAIIADKDPPGREHAQLVAGKLHGIAKSVRVIELPDLGGQPVKDAADFFAARGHNEVITELYDTTPEWVPSRGAQADAVSGGGENVENGVHFNGAADSRSAFSTFSTEGFSLDAAIYPTGSWLARYMDFARLREESADSYLIGSILPVVAATLARRVRFPWSEGWMYPNLFVMLAGKPGDRKSSAINLAEIIARKVLDKKRLLPDSLSVEALFDEYHEESGGCPDQLLIADDANPFLGLMQKSNYGERVGEWLLRLHDCKGLSESFRRNKSGENSAPKRFILETSTSIVFGATFNVCQFHGHEIRSGLQRRFNYYLAERHGRFLVMPVKGNHLELAVVTERLAKLVNLPCTECQFAPEAAELWASFQRQNRQQLEATNLESQLARLNGQPTHVLKLAMLFQVSLWAETSGEFTGLIELPTLETAISHSKHCIASAQALDAIGNRAAIEADADVLLARIQCDFSGRKANGAIQLTRTELTSKYAHHSGRRGAWKPDDLFLRFIPDLVRRGKAKEVPRPGKQSAFTFKAEET